MVDSSGRLRSNSRVCHKKQQHSPAVYSNRSGDFSADGNAVAGMDEADLRSPKT
jgi:hypothetical protein